MLSEVRVLYPTRQVPTIRQGDGFSVGRVYNTDTLSWLWDTIMFAKFLKVISDWSYLVPLTMRKFRKSNPDEAIHAYGAVKAMRSDDEEGISGIGWGFARCGTLILTEKRLVCGDWEIPLDKVKYAEAVMLGSGFVLKIADSSGSHYQFGLQKDPMWLNQSVLSVKISDEPIKYGAIIKVARVILYAGLAIWLASMVIDIF